MLNIYGTNFTSSSSLYTNSLYGNYQQPQNNYNSLFGLLLSSLLGQSNSSQSLFGNTYQNTNTTIYNTGCAYTNQTNNNNNKAGLASLLPKLLMGLLFSKLLKGNNPLEFYQDDIDVCTQAWGDPHFAIGGQQAFDFQGKDGGLYNLLENTDMKMTAKFSTTGDGNSKWITDQELTFKDSDISIVSHADKTFEVMKDGKKIADQTNYKTDKTAKKLLKDKDISLEFEENILTVKHANRTLKQHIHGGSIDNTSDTLMKYDTGLLTQTIGANDSDHDGKANSLIDVNKDGTVDDKDVLNYEVARQVMVFTPMSAKSCETITENVEAAIKKDILAGKEQGSIVKGFAEGHGYSAQQWNEYLGEKLYGVKKAEYLLK